MASPGGDPVRDSRGAPVDTRTFPPRINFLPESACGISAGIRCERNKSRAPSGVTRRSSQFLLCRWTFRHGSSALFSGQLFVATVRLSA